MSLATYATTPAHLRSADGWYDIEVLGEDDPAVHDRHVALAVAGPPGGFPPVDWDELERLATQGQPRAAATMTPSSLLDELADLERQIGQAQARQVELLAALARSRSCTSSPDDLQPQEMPEVATWSEFVGDEVAARVCWTRWQAERRVTEAQRLLQCLPRTLEALALGDVDYPRLRVVVRGTEDLDPVSAAAVDEAVAGRLRRSTTAQLRSAVEREVLAVDTEAARRREGKATADRTVYVVPLPDAQAELRAMGPAEAVQGMLQALDLLAGGQRSGSAARRFDALEAVVASAVDADGTSTTEATADPPPPGSRRRRSSHAQVLVTVSLETLVGLDNQPAELAGYGPVPAHVARRIARSGVIRRLLTDPVTGVLVGVDGHVHRGGVPPDDWPDAQVPCPVGADGGPYRPPAPMARLVRLRDQVCGAPGCRRRAERCDVDHVVPHPDGPTCPCNLHPLCRHHHRMKHEGGWGVERMPDGSRRWTAPTGHTYAEPARRALERAEVVPPDPLGPPPF